MSVKWNEDGTKRRAKRALNNIPPKLFPLQTMSLLLLLLLFLLSLLPHSHSSCGASHRRLLLLAFSHTANFNPPPPSTAGDCIRHLHLPSQNLSGTVSWMFLRNITTLQRLDLSNNSLAGSIPGGFWSSPSLTAVNLAGNRLGGSLRFAKSGLSSLNLSDNRFTAVSNVSLLRSLKSVDLSQNRIFLAPPGLNSLPSIEYLDLSRNFMAGEFPRDFPAIAGLRFLNLSCNNLTGEVDSEALDKFGSSAFVKGGIFTYVMASGERKKDKKVILAAAAAAGVVIVAVVLAGVFCCFRRRLKGNKKEEKEEEEAGEEEIGWVREARWGAEVVVFEKPLMELKFGDLAAATCGFGREALMAEGGRIGPVYRAVLKGDMNVVVRVMEKERDVEPAAAEAAFREVGMLRHRNILPLLGYCISG